MYILPCLTLIHVKVFTLTITIKHSESKSKTVLNSRMFVPVATTGKQEGTDWVLKMLNVFS